MSDCRARGNSQAEVAVVLSGKSQRTSGCLHTLEIIDIMLEVKMV